jgi:isopentenyldiphosphate isomerase
MTDYKKAWDNFKKEITKNNDPLKLKGKMYMNKTQLEKHTATICLGPVWNEESGQEVKDLANKIKETEAYKKLAEEIGIKSTSYDTKNYYYTYWYLRINY